MTQALGQRDSALRIVQGMAQNGGDLTNYIRMYPVFVGFADRALLTRYDSLFNRAPPNQYAAVWHALIALDLGDAARAQEIVRRVYARPDTIQRFINGALLGIDGLAMVARGDTARGLTIADSGLRLVGAAGGSSFIAPIQLRLALAQVGRAGTRGAGINRLRYGFTSAPEIFPATQFYLGKAYEAAGRPDSAAMAYGQFLRLWAHADTSYQSILEDARTGLARVTGEGSGGAAVGGEKQDG
jgi:hypothetical protein